MFLFYFVQPLPEVLHLYSPLHTYTIASVFVFLLLYVALIFTWYVFVLFNENAVGVYFIVALFVTSMSFASTFGENIVLADAIPLEPFIHTVLGVTGQPPRFQDDFQYHYYLGLD